MIRSLEGLAEELMLCIATDKPSLLSIPFFPPVTDPSAEAVIGTYIEASTPLTGPMITGVPINGSTIFCLAGGEKYIDIADFAYHATPRQAMNALARSLGRQSSNRPFTIFGQLLLGFCKNTTSHEDQNQDTLHALLKEMDAWEHYARTGKERPTGSPEKTIYLIDPYMIAAIDEAIQSPELIAKVGKVDLMDHLQKEYNPIRVCFIKG